ncbi:MAG: hypothetical protein NT034_02120, partial [Candidatus Magasanikbacteria bacterium]|nr:hypothetical protein [Candidatus Magasanikbacteria bacterium]
MNPTTKKILMSIGLLGAAALIAFGFYTLFKKNQTTGTAKNPTQINTGTFPSAGERTSTASGTETSTTGLNRGGVTNPLPIPQVTNGGYYQNEPVKKIIDQSVTYPSLSQGGSGLRYYNNSDGKFYHLTSDGQIKPLSDQTFYNVNKVTWANKNDKAVLEYPDSSKIIYNFEKQKQTTLPKHWSDFSFSPDSSQLAAKSIGLAPENRWLVTVNDDGTGTNLVEPMGENADKVQIDWSPSRQTVGFSQTGEALGAERQEILFVGLNHENFKSAIVEGRGFDPAWSPTGQKLLYSVYSSRSDFKPELWITDSYGDSIGNNRQLLQLNTWADKCTFSDDNTVFCAVPRDLPQGAGILPEVAANSTDDMYKIDLKTGSKTTLPLDGNYNIKNITYDKNKNKVYFTNGDQAGVFEI